MCLPCLLLSVVLGLLVPAIGSAAAPGDGVGFREGRLIRPTLGRVEIPRRKDFELRMLPRGASLEILDWPPSSEPEIQVLLPDGETAWVPPGAVSPSGERHTLTREELADSSRDKVLRPLVGLPLGVDYRWMYRHGARLHLVTLDLRVNQDLEFFPYVTQRFDERVSGRERVQEVADLGRRTRALVALNGPFFIPTGRHLGQPLGTLIAEEELLYDLDDPYVLNMHRSYLAWTNAGRFVIGESELSGRAILAEDRAGRFATEVLGEREHIVSLVGGLGLLARAGDPEVWRPRAGAQFGAHYYGRHTRRPQSILGLSDQGHRLWILVQEGFPHSERRFTLPELGHLLVQLGAEEVVFTDGGGSSDLFLAGREVVRTENAGDRRPNSCVLVVREKRSTSFSTRSKSRYSSS